MMLECFEDVSSVPHSLLLETDIPADLSYLRWFRVGKKCAYTSSVSVHVYPYLCRCTWVVVLMYCSGVQVIELIHCHYL